MIILIGLGLNVQKSQGGGLGKNQPMFTNQSSFNNFRKTQMFDGNEEGENEMGKETKSTFYGSKK